MADAAYLPSGPFTVEIDHGEYILNHPESQTWSDELRAKVLQAAKSVLPPGARASVM